MGNLITRTFIPGQPKTKGSMTPIGNGRMTQTVPGSEQWARIVKYGVQADRRNRGLTVPAQGAVSVDLVFAIHPGAMAPVVGLPVRARSGDVDKLARNILDALTEAGAIQDDVLVAKLSCVKIFSERSGVAITVTELDDAEMALIIPAAEARCDIAVLGNFL